MSNINRKIPATMATQHPDNAKPPYWEKDGDGFISTREEAQELYSSFADLGCQEFMWDWEGKYVDEAVVDRLFHTYYDYFKKHQLGRDKFLTFRIPNILHERGYSLARAMMGIITAESFARDLSFHCPPLFEVILPMTKRAEDIISIQKTFTKLSTFKAKVFGEDCRFNSLRVLPLLEGISDLFSCQKLLNRYVALHKKFYKIKPPYLRVHIARSDPALNAGLVSAVIAGKVALSELAVFAEKNKIPIFPAIGVGTLPFRGSLSPLRVSDFLNEYSGIKTAYIQSAFRYDFPLSKVKPAIQKLNQELPKTQPLIYSAKECAKAHESCSLFTFYYKKTIEKLAESINTLSEQVPSRRERKLHIGLFGYSRKVGKKRLPRAIPFTAILYSLGVPPEFIGTGRGLEEALRTGFSLEKFYRNFIKDMRLAGKFLNKENLSQLASKNSGWKDIQEDVDILEQSLGLELGPKTDLDFIHRNITSTIFYLLKRGESVSKEIIESGKIRGSLG